MHRGARFYPPITRGLATAALLLTSACSSTDPVVEDPVAAHPAERRARVAVADGASGDVHIIDVEFGELRATLSLPSAATGLQASFTGNLGIATTTSGTSFFTSGVSVVDHTGEGWEGREHIHVYKFAPQTLTFALEPDTYASSYGGRWAAFAQGEAGMPSQALTFDEAPLIQNEVPTPVTAELEAHSGLAVPLDDGGLLATVVDPMGEPGLVRLDASGTETARQTGCSSPGAALRLGDMVVVSCQEGWWLVEPGESGLEAELVAYDHEGAVPAHLLGHVDAALIGARIDESWTWVDHASRTSGQTSLPAGACDVAYEDEMGDALMVLSDDGSLHVVDPRTGQAQRDAVAVAPAFDCNDEVRPRLATAPQLAFVTIPSTGSMVELDSNSLAERVRYELGGQPSLVTSLGVDPNNRNAGYCFTCQ